MSNLMENIKNLRDRTGAGFLDCKKALEENNNDLENSIDFLRKKGLAKAFKKSSREAKEGAIGVYSNNLKTVIIEVNTETDFAAKNDTFLNFMDKIGNYLLTVDSKIEILLEDFQEMSFDSKKISEHFTDIISKIGENIVLSKIKIYEKKSNNEIFVYTHNNYRKNIGKICSILNAEINENNDDLKKFGKNMCMHIAASKPIALDVDKINPSDIEKEKEVQLASINSSGKSEDILNKILQGKMNKFFSEVTLLNQIYIFDTDKKVKDAISEFNSKNLFKIITYDLFVIGS